MLPEAYVSHRTPHRFRIRIPSKRKDQSFFSRTEDQLRLCDLVEGTQSNALTGSLLILHRGHPGDFKAIRDYSKKGGLFQIQSAPPVVSLERRTLGNQIAESLADWDERILKESNGAIDLRTLGIGTLLGLGTLQIFTGRILPPAWTLYSTAVALLMSVPDCDPQAERTEE